MTRTGWITFFYIGPGEADLVGESKPVRETSVITNFVRKMPTMRHGGSRRRRKYGLCPMKSAMASGSGGTEHRREGRQPRLSAWTRERGLYLQREFPSGVFCTSIGDRLFPQGCPT